MTVVNDAIFYDRSRLVGKSVGNVRFFSDHFGRSEILVGNAHFSSSDSLKFSGLPNHELQVKVDSPITLLRNLDPKKSLCNGTRLIVTRCYQFLVEARIIMGNKIGDITYIPRTNMSPADKTFPARVKRKLFPISVCYAMTVNKR